MIEPLFAAIMCGITWRPTIHAPLRSLEVAVERHAERVVGDVGGDHDRAEGGEEDELGLVEAGVEPLAQLALDRVRVGRQAAAEVDDQLVELVERQRVRVLAVVDQDAAEERRADQAVVLDRDRVAEQRRAALAQQRHDLAIERIPLQQRLESGRGVRERPLHVRHAPAGGGVGVGARPRCFRRSRVIEQGDPGHQPMMPA